MLPLNFDSIRFLSTIPPTFLGSLEAPIMAIDLGWRNENRSLGIRAINILS